MSASSRAPSWRRHAALLITLTVALATLTGCGGNRRGTPKTAKASPAPSPKPGPVPPVTASAGPKAPTTGTVTIAIPPIDVTIVTTGADGGSRVGGGASRVAAEARLQKDLERLARILANAKGADKKLAGQVTAHLASARIQLAAARRATSGRELEESLARATREQEQAVEILTRITSSGGGTVKKDTSKPPEDS